MVEAVVDRKTGAEDVVWDLSAFYQGPDDPAIQQTMDALDANVRSFAETYRGRVADLDAEEMYEALQTMETLTEDAERLYNFAGNSFSTDTSSPQLGALLQKVTEFFAQLNQNLVFFDLEWNNADEAKVQTLLQQPLLEKHKHYLEAKRRYQPYQLSEIEEQLLADKDVTGRSAWTRFFTQLTSAMRLDYEGEKLTLTQVLTKLHDEDRDVRRKANEAITQALREKSMELTYIFNVLTVDKASNDKRRHYPSWVSSRNLSNKAPDEVVEALIQAVTDNYELVSRHYHLKRVLLGLDELTEYDRYAPLPIEASETFYTWDEARAIVLKAFYAFSPRFGEIAQKFFDENWIHAPVLPNKRGGAYCASGTPATHPLVLVNYTGTERDVMTLAHELGHGIHAYLSAEAQGILGMDYPLTTAEMASTFGEMLVFTDMMQAEADPKVRLKMLSGKIEDTFATVFRQISMNRFEDGLHTARREEGELSTERVNEIWMQSQRAMFGDSVNLSDAYSQWWSYVPHFLHTPGYVYAYSFGELLVLALFNIYQERGAAFVPQFIEVLASGDSDWPENILAKAGVDLTDLNFWNEGLNIIREMVEQEEALAREVYPEKFA